LTAYEHFIEGRASFYLLSRSSVETANQRLRSAIACEPGFAAAHAWLAETCWLSWWAGWCGAGNASLLDARDHARSAVELDAREAQGFAELGQALLFLGEPEQARTAIRKAMTLNPHDPDVITIAAFEQLYQGDTAAADAVIREAIRYDPNGHYGLVQSLIHMANEQWREALSALLTVRAKIPEVEAWLAAAMAMCGRPEAARDAALRYANARETPPPGFDAIGWIMHRHPFASDKHDRTIRAALAAAGLAETQGGSER
jgi:tetratricopeptide (TPR) repeat protein